MAMIDDIDPLTGGEVLGDDSAIEWLKQRFELAIRDPNSYYNRFAKPAIVSPPTSNKDSTQPSITTAILYPRLE